MSRRGAHPEGGRRLPFLKKAPHDSEPFQLPHASQPLFLSVMPENLH